MLPNEPRRKARNSLANLRRNQQTQRWCSFMETNLIDLERILNDPLSEGCAHLWAMLILLAITDKATEVRYEPWRKKGVLRFTVQGVQIEMVPPPSDLPFALKMVKAIHRLYQPGQDNTWRRRLARTLRRWADRLDPPLYYRKYEVQLNLDLGTSVSVRSNPAGDAEKWIGVVLRFVPDEACAAKARTILQRWHERDDKSHRSYDWVE